MIRFVCAVETLRRGSWGALSYQYLLALAKTGPTRAISLTGPAAFNTGTLWDRVADLFTTPYETFETNVICGPAGFLDRLWTKDCYNIAILGGPNPRPPNIEVLAKYDEVWTAQEWCLADYYGINTKYVPYWVDLSPFVR